MSNRNAVREHYDEFLAEYYDWMFGTPVEVIAEEQKVALQAAGVKPGRIGWVRAQLQKSGFAIGEECSGRMCTIVAAKPWSMQGD